MNPNLEYSEDMMGVKEGADLECGICQDNGSMMGVGGHDSRILNQDSLIVAIPLNLMCSFFTTS